MCLPVLVWKMNVEKGKRVEAEGPSVDGGKGPGEMLRQPRGEGEVGGPRWNLRRWGDGGSVPTWIPEAGVKLALDGSRAGEAHPGLHLGF